MVAPSLPPNVSHAYSPLNPQAQTPQQRRANEAYARSEAAKRGKPQAELKKREKPQKPPISRVWVYLLIFVVMGGIVFELVRIIWGAFA